jgi:hypothetical protein
MANPDLPRSRVTPKEATARVPPPEIVDMPSSFDMDLFPSELPADAAAPPAAVDTPAPEESTDHDHAAVLNFASRANVAPAPVPDQPSTEPGDALTLLQLIESDPHVSWREAVAIVQQLCLKLKDVPSHAPVLIEPGAIQITSSGHLNLLSSQQGGDPLVIQLGRLLRSLVGAETIPSELRLLISQATFELAIFESVEHFRKALDALLGPPDTTEVKTAFRKAAHHPVEKHDPPPIEPFVEAPAPRQPPPSLLPQPTPKRKVKPYRERRFDNSGLLLRVAAAIVVTAAAVAVYVMSKDLRVPSSPPAPQYVAPAVRAEQTADTPVSTPTTGRRDAAPKPPAKTPQPEITSRLTTRVPERVARTMPRASGRSTPSPSGADGPDPVTSVAPTPAPTPSSTNESPVELIRRASALFSEGKAADAGIVLDLLVMTAPLYDPGPNELTAIGFDAFRSSQRQLLPNIAARELERATAALNSGDIDRAVTLGASVSAMLDRFDSDSAYPLRSRLQQLLRRTEAARNATENAVYGAADSDVTPPLPLSRQFPEGVPVGVPAARIGTLDLIVGKTGDVEFVKLHTPMNRYHERMIVSAVKAWRYIPALRAGKPVRFKLTISVNLPEAGNGSSQ